MPKKVLYVNDTSVLGGSDISLTDLIRYLDKDIFQPVVLLPRECILADRLRALNVDTRVIKLGPYQRVNIVPHIISIYNIYSVLRKMNPAMVIAASRPAQYYAAWAAKLAGVLNVCHFRDIINWKDYLKFSNWSIRMADLVIAVSHAAERSLLEGGISPRKIVVVHNGVDIEELNAKSNPAEVKKEFGFEEGEHWVGMFGRVVPKKGFDIFIKAAAEVLEVFPRAKFFIVGSALEIRNARRNHLAELKSLCAQLGLEPRIVFAGFRDDVYDFMGAMDLVVHVSFQESFGRTLIEAMALGKPVVATESGGIPEIIGEGEGILIPVGDINAAAKAIIDCLSDKEKRESMAQRGKEKVKRCFELKTQMKKIQDSYVRLLKQRGRF